MGNSCSLNICLNTPRTSSQSEDENYLRKNLSEPAIISPRDKHTATVSLSFF